MGFAGARLQNFCLSRVITHIRVRSSPIDQAKAVCNSSFTAADDEQKHEFPKDEDKVFGGAAEAKPGCNTLGKRIMIVMDSSPEAKGALHWALSHTVQTQDTIILVSVSKSRKQGKDPKETNPRLYDLLSSMKNICHSKRPEVRIEISLLEGKEKGAMIVEEAKKQGATLLVLGQRKRSMRWQLLMIWAGGKFGTGGVVEYCIQNAHCMTIAVRRKSRKLGGYLITTKRHKDFWLLA